MSGNGRVQRATLPSQELLDDLCSRFVLNAPEEELQSFERILFLVEQAHWFYEDNTMEQNASLKTLTLRDFTSLMFQSCAALRPYIAHIDDIYKDFTSYKIRVPVTGAIILDETFERCLLVKGWKPGASWSFPRGKKNKDEEDHTCAVREVLEETGFDISSLMKVEQHLEVVIGQQRMRLYIIPGISSKDTPFAPQTKKEISEIAWHRVDELPVASNEAHSHNRGPTGMKYFMVWPFVIALKRWIHAHRAAAAPKTDSSTKGTTVWKVKPNGGSHSHSHLSNSAGTSVPPAAASPPVKPAASPTVKPALSATVAADLTHLAHPNRENPGGSFRNFRFDRARVLQRLEV